MRVVDTLFVAVTRPAMKLGVPYQGYIVNGLVTTVIVMFFIQVPPGYLLGVGVHLAMRELCRTNPHFFHKWQLFFMTKMRSPTGQIWGGSRLQPNHAQIKRATELQVGV